jgi:CHAT domain-containing protein
MFTQSRSCSCAFLIAFIVALVFVPARPARAQNYDKSFELHSKAWDLINSGKPKEAEPFVRGYLALARKNQTSSALEYELAWIGGYYQREGDDAKAEALLQEGLSLAKKNSNTVVADSIAGHLLQMRTRQRRFEEALTLYRTVIPSYAKLMGARSNFGWTYQKFANVAHRVAEANASQYDALLRESFVNAQRVRQSSSAYSLSLMAARGAKGNAELAAVARSLQDLSREDYERSNLDYATGQIPADKRDVAAEVANLRRWTVVEEERRVAKLKIDTLFREYYELAQVQPLTVEEAQSSLRPDEALVLLLDTDLWNEVFVWIVTKTETRWIRTDFVGQPLIRIITDLRCGLDASLWYVEPMAKACASSLRTEPPRDGLGNINAENLPFDLTYAHLLYRHLFGSAEDLIKDKHLLLVASDIFAQLPFQVLVTQLPGADRDGFQEITVPMLGINMENLSEEERKRARLKQGVKIVGLAPTESPNEPPDIKIGDIVVSINGKAPANIDNAVEIVRAHSVSDQVTVRLVRDGKEITKKATLRAGKVKEAVPHLLDTSVRDVAWLARANPITVLPSVSSLKVLRELAKPSAATKAMIGFGNPLLDGDPRERPWEANWAREARDKQTCTKASEQRVASVRAVRAVLPAPMHSGLADFDHLRSQTPLPDTADELCAAAAALRLPPEDIYLGAKATEANIKRLSAEGELARYKVLHFATHGTLAGEIENTSEPGLILTPPSQQSEGDDGYPSVSDIANLKLDADWVVLSACNTAAGGGKDLDALSGLARAFLYAGARALLVSHWAVDSAATVKLVTSAVEQITTHNDVGRSEALRRAALSMIDGPEPRYTHPALWAPFSVVGEGALFVRH